MVFLVGEIFYLKNKDYNADEKLEFVRLTGINSFAFYIQTPYLRHQFSHDVNEIYSYHPSFRESKIGTFTNTGYEKRFINLKKSKK